LPDIFLILYHLYGIIRKFRWKGPAFSKECFFFSC
jgi:hypothetical protein